MSLWLRHETWSFRKTVALSLAKYFTPKSREIWMCPSSTKIYLRSPILLMWSLHVLGRLMAVLSANKGIFVLCLSSSQRGASCTSGSSFTRVCLPYFTWEICDYGLELIIDQTALQYLNSIAFEFNFFFFCPEKKMVQHDFAHFSPICQYQTDEEILYMQCLCVIWWCFNVTHMFYKTVKRGLWKWDIERLGVQHVFPQCYIVSMLFFFSSA